MSEPEGKFNKPIIRPVNSKQQEQRIQAMNNLISSAISTASNPAIQTSTSNRLISQQNQAMILKNNNRYTLAADSLDKIYTGNSQKHFKNANLQAYATNISEVSKTPESDLYSTKDLSNQFQSRMVKNTGSMGTLGDSDHDVFESSATGNSGSGSNGLEGDESAEEDYDSNNVSISGNSLDEQSDYTTKRLKTFVATTLHNEIVYLSKLSILLKFKQYLEEQFKGCTQADLSVLFSSISQIYTTHDIVASKLQEYLQSLNELINNSLTSNASNTGNNNSTVSTIGIDSKSAKSGITFSNSSSASNKFVLTSLQSNTNTKSILAMKENFLASALQLLANIMEISFPVYLEFLKNYSKSMTILNKLENSKLNKSFSDCQVEFNKSLQNYYKRNQKTQHLINKDPYNIYYNDKPEEEFDITKMFTEDILRRPTKLFEFIYSLKDECMLASKELPNHSSHALQTNIKSLFDNAESKKLQEKVFFEINRNIMPKVIRKNEDVVELIENSNDKKLRHLILYGDSLVCCKLKKDKGHLKWFIPIDRLETFLDEYKSSRPEKEIRHLREEVLSLRGDLKRQSEGGNSSSRNQQKIKKKLVEQENELAIKSSRLKLIVRSNPSLSLVSSTHSSNISSTSSSGLFSSNSAFAAFSNSMSNLANLNHKSINQNSNSNNISLNHHYQQPNSSSWPANTSNNSANNPSQNFIILFTSDFERNAWLEEINGAIHGFKARKTTIQLSQSDIEARINSLKKSEEVPKAIISSCTGSLELLIKHIDELSQPNKVYVAVELKSCGSYLQVAQTDCSELTKNPTWNEKFNLELQCVDSLRIILYSQTSSKALALSSQELKVCFSFI
jgi:hypothetical protein